MSLTVPRRIGSTPTSGVWVAWRIARGLLAAASLVAAVAGVPWALLQYTRWPISGLPAWEQISDFPAGLVTQDSVIIGLFTLGLWAAWAVFTACVVVEIIGEIRGTNRTRIPAVGPLQRLARTLVASVAMTFGSLGSLTAHGAGGSLASATAVTATAVAFAPDTPTPAGAAEAPPDADYQWQVVNVDHGDTAWELAERHYGDGTRWVVLWEDNCHELQPDGRTWANQSDPIEAGWHLRIRADSTQPAAAMIVEATVEQPSSEPAPAPPTAPASEVTVQPGDNFWSLATDRLEDVLGRPATDDEIAPYWVQMIEANTDRLVQVDNPNLIHPGQTFVLPPIGQPTPAGDAPETSTPPPPPTEAPPDPGDNSPSGTPRPDQPTTTATPSESAPPSTEQPATTEPSGTGSGGSPNSTGTTTPRPTTTSPDERDAPGDTTPPGTDPPATDDGDSSVVTVVGTLTAGTALAVGVVHAIRQRRRRRNHRNPTTAPRPSSDPQLHRELIDAADENAHNQLGHALRHLASALAAAGTSSRPRIVQHDPEHLDVLFDVPAEPAADGWTAQADGAVWSCDPTQLDTSSHDEVPATTPLLVTLGRPDDGGQLYLDLEAEGAISLCGDPSVARDIARAWVAELAHSPLAGSAQLIVIGNLGTASIATLDRTTVVEDWAAVADNLHAWAEQSHDALVRNDWPNAFVARAHHSDHDALIPLVVFADQPPDAQDLAELQAIEPRAAAVVVVGDEISDATVIDCAPGRLSLPQLGLVCEPQALDIGRFDAIVELLDDAEDPAGEQLQLLPDDDPATEQPHVDETGNGEAAVTSNGGPYQDPPYDILVRLLGDITVEGAARRLTPKQTAVLAYIALHRTVSADRAGDALWPEQAASWRRRLSNTVSACRSAIGGQHLPLADDSTYRAGPRLLTDTELFTRRMAAATTQSNSQAIETLRGAIDLVDGPLFHYPDKERTPYAWVSLEDWISVWEHKVTAVACQLSDAYLATGNTQEAVEIAQRIHAILPTSTELTELLMRCYAALGDRVAVRRVYHAHLDALAALDLDDPAESTAALYDELRAATAG